jgi:hypothetical protein
MDLLNEYGRQGWHSIGFGTLYHDMKKDSRPWEHRRVPFLSALRQPKDGWQRIGTLWFPWSYQARPVPYRRR